MGCSPSRGVLTGPGLDDRPYPSNRFRRDWTVHQNGAVVQRDVPLSARSEFREMSAEEEQIAEVMQGNPVIASDNLNRIVRIFTSSTFTDTRHERNALMERVYPKLKVFCRQRGYQFQVVDMRWGVRDEAANDHMTTELCMQELKACQMLSTGPNFVTFLSHKYGYRPLLRVINAEKFEVLFNAVSSTEAVQLLKKWYVRDDNAVPPAYILQPIGTHHPAFLDKDQSEAFNDAKLAWWRESELMQGALSTAAQQVLEDANEAHIFRRSVTENEIFEGILALPNCADHCLWFNRHIQEVDKQPVSSLLSRFTDCRGSPEYVEESKALLQKLKDIDLPASLPKTCIKTYNIPWTKNAIDPSTCKSHKTYIDSLCEDFESLMKLKISGAINRRNESPGATPLVEEVSQHAVFCQTKIKSFQGRQNMMDQVETYLVGSSTRPLVIHGPSGCGKTSVMAMAAHQAWELHDGKALILLRFIGTTPDSTHIRSLLHSVLSQMTEVFESPEAVPNDLKSLTERFAVMLHLATADQPIVLILDSLDQFSPENGARQMSWLPTCLPKHVKLLVSTLPGEQYECFPRLKMLLKGDENYLTVPALTSGDVSSILTSWLRQQNRTLTSQQFTMVTDTFKHCPLPLFLKLCFDDACRWQSYMVPERVVLEHSIQDAIRRLFQRLEKSHGEVLVAKALGYLTLSRNGLSEDELEDILSCDEEVLTDVYQYWTPPVRRLPPLLLVRIKSDLSQYLVDRGADGVRVMYWYHRQFIEAAAACYCSDQNVKRNMHQCIAEHFLGSWAGTPKPFTDHKTGQAGAALRYVAEQPLKFDTQFNLRKLMELPFHVIHAQMIEVLKADLLCSLAWLTAKLQATSLRQVLEDFSLSLGAFPEDNDLRVVSEALQLSHGALNYDSRQLPGQIVGRISTLCDADNGTEGVQKLLCQCRSPPYPCLIPAQNILTPPGGPLVHALSEHTHDINCLDLSSDGRVAITSSDDGSLKVWDVDEGRLVKSIETDSKELQRCRLCLNNQSAVVNDDKHLYLIKLETSEITVLDGDTTGIDGVAISAFIIFDHVPSLVIPVNQGISFVRLPTASVEFVIHNQYMGNKDRYGRYGDLIDGHRNFIATSCQENHGSNIGHEVHIADVGNRRFVHRVQVFQRPASEDDDDHTVDALAMTLDESQVVVADFFTNDLRFISTETGQLVRKISGNEKDMADNFHLTPDGQTLYFANSSNVCLWDLEKGKVSYQIEEAIKFQDVRTVDKRRFVTTGSDAVVRIWDVSRRNGSSLEEKKNQVKYCHIEQIPNSSRYILMGQKPEKSDKDNTLTIGVYDIAVGKWIPQVKLSEVGIVMKAVNEDMFIILKARKLRVVNFVTRTVLMCVGRTGQYNNVETVADKCWAVVFSRGRMNLKVYDLFTGRVRAILNGGQKLRLEEFKVSEDGSVAVAFGEKWPILLYDVVAGVCLHKLFMLGEVDIGYDYAITPDNKYLVHSISRVPEEQRIEENMTYPVVFDLRKGVLVHHLGDWEAQLKVEAEDQENDASMCVLAVSNTVAVTGHYDLDIRVWDLAKGQLLHRLEGHTHDISHMVWSPDRSQLVSYTSQPEENALRLWDATSWQCIATFKVDDKDSMGDVCVFGDGRVLLPVEGRPEGNNMPSELNLTQMKTTKPDVAADSQHVDKVWGQVMEVNLGEGHDTEGEDDLDTDMDETDDESDDDEDEDGNSWEFRLKEEIPALRNGSCTTTTQLSAGSRGLLT